jgi:hypothetical protein
MVDTKIADEITKIAQKQLLTSQNFKQPRMVEILDNENINNFKLRPALQGRLNIPFDSVFMSGFIDSLVSETNLPPILQFEDPNGSNLKSARKIESAWRRDSKTMRLRMKNRGMKKIAALSGRGIGKYYAESDPKYKPILRIVDYLDFHCEPNGGGHLDDHYFQGEENIFRSKEELLAGGDSKWYEGSQVSKLIASYSAPDFKRNNDTYANKTSRYATLGLDMEANNYVGGTLFNLVEWETVYEGKKYHLVFDKPTGIWLRCVPLVEDFGNDLAPWFSFASPMEDAFNFWNLGPADKAKPTFEAIRVNLNEVLNNNRKRNWDMKAVDSNMFPDLRKLDWRQDGIVHASVPLNQTIQAGIYRFETPEITGALNLNAYLNNLAGEKLGVTPGTQGNASETKVGIYQGNQLQISKKMRLINDSYNEMFEDLGKRYDWGLWDHASEDEMVRLVSTDGVGWEKITKEDKDPEYVVVAIASEAEKMENSDLVRAKLEALMSVEKDPNQMKLVNVKAHLEEKYRLAGFSDEKIDKLMNTKSDATDEVMSEAKKDIENILSGKKMSLNFGATTSYLQFISDWILKNSGDLNPEKKKLLEDHFEKHVPIAMKNAEQEQFRTEQLMKQRQAESIVVNPKTASDVSIGAPVMPTI